MSGMERVTVALPATMAEQLRAAVDAGEYATTSEIVRDALRLWESRRELRARELGQLKDAWNAGKASGNAKPLDVEAVIDRARRKRG
jgi:antitoxin ParD1/3/4